MGYIFDLLPTGKENATSTAELMRITHAKDERDLRSMIAAERKAGAAILSTKGKGGGYYKAASDAELREFLQTYSKEARSIFYMMRAARLCLQDDPNQTELAL